MQSGLCRSREAVIWMGVLEKEGKRKEKKIEREGKGKGGRDEKRRGRKWMD